MKIEVEQWQLIIMVFCSFSFIVIAIIKGINFLAQLREDIDDVERTVKWLKGDVQEIANKQIERNK